MYFCLLVYKSALTTNYLYVVNFQCRKEGHMAADCEEPDKCRFCGEEGHKAGDCTGAKTHEVTKEDGTKHEIYIPSEVKLLFDFKRHLIPN